jgi:DNA repair exonuclease SbcCD ATPase subunit
MLQFKKVTLHNFGSYGHADVGLQNKGFCLVTGVNRCKKDNALSNGAGKSQIWNGISFALTGETVNGLHSNLKNLAAAEDDEAYVALSFSHDSDSFEITRFISPNTDLKIIKNGEDVSGKGIRESEKKLAEQLPDLTKDLIASTIIIGQGMPNKFSSFSPSGRKELLEKLTKSDFMIDDIKNRVSSRENALNSKLREYEDSLLVNRTSKDGFQATLDADNKLLASLKRPDFDAEILEANSALSAATAGFNSASAELDALDADTEKTNSALMSKMTEKSKVGAQELIAYNSVMSGIKADRSGIENKIAALKDEIARLKSIKDVCPVCGQKIAGVIKPDTSKQELELIKWQQQLPVFAEREATVNKEHKSYLDEIDATFAADLSELNGHLAGNKSKASELKLKKSGFSSQMDSEKRRLDKLCFDKANWDKNKLSVENAAASLKDSVAKLDSAIKLTEDGKLDTQEHLAVVKKMETLIKRDFRGYLLSNVIAYINKKAKEYCKTVFGTDELDVRLDDNDLDIAYCGKMFDNLSGGEKQRVDLILQFAIRNMLIFYLGADSNMLVLDEITDFLDKRSCDAVMSLVESELDSIDSVFIVSHHAEELELPIDSELHVVKDENGISEITA